MRLTVNEAGCLELEEVYNPLILTTEEGHMLSLCMRDDTFEIEVCPSQSDEASSWRVNMQDGTIARQGAEHD